MEKDERQKRNLQLAEFLTAHGYEVLCVAEPGTKEKQCSADYLYVSFDKIPDQTETNPVGNS
jgi:predicted CoA-binding protein